MPGSVWSVPGVSRFPSHLCCKFAGHKPCKWGGSEGRCFSRRSPPTSPRCFEHPSSPGFFHRAPPPGQRATPPAMGVERSKHWYSSQFENNYFTEMCRGSVAGWYLRLIVFVYHSNSRLESNNEEDSAHGLGVGYSGAVLQGYLAHKKQPPPRNLQ